ncbi:MAG: hypothetical protein H7Y17_08460 [Chlorobia bacterium]|nr:hypothetical protein [Fimbriimonadaceae bacterium]
MKRLMFTVARGKPRYAEMAMGLGRSLSLIGDETPRAVLTDIEGYDWAKYFDFVWKPTEPRSALDKLFAIQFGEFDAVYAIDGDCLAFKRLDPVFAHCRAMPLAVQGTWQTEGKWHGAEVASVLAKENLAKLPKFNGGALYYEKGPDFDRLLESMRDIEGNYADTGFGDFRGNASEEVCVALAMMRTGIGQVISDDTDFMNTGAGIIGKLHLDVTSNTCRFLSRKQKVRYVEPYVFHASEYCNFSTYWRQLDLLKRLEKYEDTHRPGYRSRWFKFRRSLARRLLKLQGRIE